MPSIVPLLLALQVSVEIPLTPAEEELMLSACTKALAKEACEASTTIVERVTDAEPDALGATVRKLDEDTIAVSVYLEGRELKTELTFEEDDALEERARSIGLAIGLLGSTFSREQPSSSMSPTKMRSSPSSTSEMPLLPPPLYSARDGWEDGAVQPLNATHRGQTSSSPIVSFASMSGVFEIEPGLDAFGAGGGVLAGYQLLGGLLGTLGGHVVHFPRHDHPFHLTTITGYAGPSYQVNLPHLDLLLQLQIGAEALLFQSLFPLPNAVDSHGTGLIRAAILLGLRLTDSLALQVAPQIQWSWSPSDVFVGNELAASTSSIRPGITLGVAFTDRKGPRS